MAGGPTSIPDHADIRSEARRVALVLVALVLLAGLVSLVAMAGLLPHPVALVRVGEVLR